MRLASALATLARPRSGRPRGRIARLLGSPAARRLGAVAGRLPRPSSRVVVAVTLTLGLLLGTFLLVRDSSMVRVHDVFITGLSSSQETRIRQSLRSAALEMTTLHVREDELLAAVSEYASVADLRVDADFPHGLSIEVVERVPVGVVELNDRRVPVTAGGLLLHGVRADDGLALIRSRRGAAGERLTDPRAVAAVEVLAAAPPALRHRAARAGFGAKGLVVDMRSGPELIFGSRARARAKWLAAARVLADPSTAGATYLDLRIPERVGAGGLEPAEPQEAPTTPQAEVQAQAPAAPQTTTPQPQATPQATTPTDGATATTPEQTPTPNPGVAAADAARAGGAVAPSGG